MNRLPSHIATMALAEGLLRRPHVVDGTGILLLNGQWRGVPTWCQEVLGDALAELEALVPGKVQHVSINIVLPGGGSGVHVDPSPGGAKHHRWHLPLKTNLGAWFDDEDGRVWMAPGWWWGPVKYWLPHSVGNDGVEPRVHLICDLR